MPQRRGSRVQAIAFGIVIAMLGATALGAVLAARSEETPRDTLTAVELQAYQGLITPHLTEGGKIVQLGMKPAMTDLATPGGIPAATIAGEADAWVAALTGVRQRVAAVIPPEQLREAHRLFDEALGRYLEAARLFGQAARAPAAEQRAAIDRGIAVAEIADDVYDAASRILQRLRRELGLGVTADFPDPDAPTTPAHSPSG